MSQRGEVGKEEKEEGDILSWLSLRWSDRSKLLDQYEDHSYVVKGNRREEEEEEEKTYLVRPVVPVLGEQRRAMKKDAK
jgi:hypothetical protein